MYKQIKMRKLQDMSLSKGPLQGNLNHGRVAKCQLRVHDRLSGTHYSICLKESVGQGSKEKVPGR